MFGFDQVNNVASVPVLKVRLLVNGISLSVEIDTGAACSVISYDVYLRYFKNVPCYPYPHSLKVFSGDVIPTVGQINVDVKYNNVLYKELFDIKWCFIISKLKHHYKSESIKNVTLSYRHYPILHVMLNVHVSLQRNTHISHTNN